MQVGAWITNSIELTKPIARGAMGYVWVGWHHELKIHVAVKFVSNRLGDEEEAEAIKRFEREAAVAAQIRSPHVVKTFESGCTRDGEPYIVMEFLHGETLGERLRREGRIDIDDATTVLQHTARGLNDAHELGVVHRDIKPDNIFLCSTESGFFCKLVDFGIAKQTRLPAMGGLTTDGKMVGTPEYMSPEQVLEERAVDYRADLWALAVVMYQALTGHLPFTGATLGQLCLNLVGKTPAKPTHYRPDLPRRVDAWFARALNRDAQMRFTSAMQMAESFATLDDHVAFHVAAPLAENTERHLSSSHTLGGSGAYGKKRSTVVTAAGVAAAVAVLGGGSWIAAQPKEPTILAQQALAPMVNQVAQRALESAERAAASPSASAPEAVPEPEVSAPSPSSSPEAPPPRPQPVALPQPAPAPAPPPPPPPRTKKKKRGRTYGNTGF